MRKSKFNTILSVIVCLIIAVIIWLIVKHTTADDNTLQNTTASVASCFTYFRG